MAAVYWFLAGVSGAATVALSLYLAVHKYQVDIDVYYLAGRHAFAPDLYSVNFANLPFTYTPFAAILFAPLALNATLRSAQELWTAANAVTLIALLLVAIRLVRPTLDRMTAVKWALGLSFPALLLNPLFGTIGLGQVNLMLDLLVLWDIAGKRQIMGRTVPLGIGTGLAAAVKLIPLIFVPYLLLTRRARGAWTCVGTFVLCGAAAWIASPSASRIYWTKDVLQARRAGALLYSSDQNLWTFLERVHHGPVSGALLLPLLIAVTVGGLAVAAWAYRRSSPMLGLLVCAATSLLVSPITWSHHMVWVGPVIVWLLWGTDRPRGGRVWAAAAAALFWVAPIWWVPTTWRPTSDPPELHENAWRLFLGNSFFLAFAAFLVGVTVMVWRRTRSRPAMPAPGGGADPGPGQRPIRVSTAEQGS